MHLGSEMESMVAVDVCMRRGDAQASRVPTLTCTERLILHASSALQNAVSVTYGCIGSGLHTSNGRGTRHAIGCRRRWNAAADTRVLSIQGEDR